MNYKTIPPSLFHVILAITIISQTLGEEVIPVPTGYGEVGPQCNSTCRYVEWAFDANCRQRGLVAVPFECWEAKMLDLRDNRIVQVLANVFKSFHNLLYVDLEDNGITDLDTSAFVGNDRVRHIYLQNNLLETIRGETFTGVPNLIQLYLNSNRISTVEVGAFSGLSKLETLFLSENLLDEIPTGLLKGLERLRYFHMTDNRLATLHNNTFRDLANLRHLNLINNNIRSIEAGAFKGLISLRVLRLAYNDISMIGYRAFFQMRHLIQLDLYSNKIQTVSNITTGLQNIQELFLGDNPLKCDCQVEPLRLWLKTHYVTDSKANATCNDPEIRVIANMDIIVCPPALKISSEQIIKETNIVPAKVKQYSIGVKEQDNSYQQFQNNAVHTSTIAVIAIACVVLFAVCFVGLICFIYNAKFRKPYYDHIDDKTGSYEHIKVTLNPLPEAAEA